MVRGYVFCFIHVHYLPDPTPSSDLSATFSPMGEKDLFLGGVVAIHRRLRRCRRRTHRVSRVQYELSIHPGCWT